VVLLSSPIGNTYLVCSSEVLWKFIVDRLQFGYFLVNIPFIPGEDEQTIHVFRLNCDDLLGKIYGLGFLYPFVLIDEGDTDVCVEEGGFEVDDLLVDLECGLIALQVVEDVGVSHIEGVALYLPQHLLVPLQALLQLVVHLVLEDESAVAEGECVVGVPLDPARLPSLGVPLVDEPLVPG
jgi:hypothetical protein